MLETHEFSFWFLTLIAKEFKDKNAKSLTSRDTRAPWIPKYLHNGGVRVASRVTCLFFKLLLFQL